MAPWRQSSSPVIRMIWPRAGERVNHVEYITVDFDGLPVGTTIFAVVRAPSGVYYPQSSPVSLAVGAGPQRAIIGGVFFGGGFDQNIGEAFELSFAAATEEQSILALIAAGERGGIPQSAWPPPGVAVFPGGAVVRR